MVMPLKMSVQLCLQMTQVRAQLRLLADSLCVIQYLPMGGTCTRYFVGNRKCISKYTNITCQYNIFSNVVVRVHLPMFIEVINAKYFPTFNKFLQKVKFLTQTITVLTRMGNWFSSSLNQPIKIHNQSLRCSEMFLLIKLLSVIEIA